MQEEANSQAVNYCFKVAKLTLDELQKTSEAFHSFNKSQINKISTNNNYGKITVKDLSKQGAGMTHIDVDADSLNDFKYFDKFARKYALNYAITKEKYSDELRNDKATEKLKLLLECENEVNDNMSLKSAIEEAKENFSEDKFNDVLVQLGIKDMKNLDFTAVLTKVKETIPLHSFFLWFKAHDSDAIDKAFSEFSKEYMKDRSSKRTSVKEKLAKAMDKVIKEQPSRNKHQELGR